MVRIGVLRPNILTLTNGRRACYLVVAVIGFVDTYEVIEGVNTSVTIEIALLSGTLGQEVEVRVFTVDDSALGKIVNCIEKLTMRVYFIVQLPEIISKSHSSLDSLRLQPASVLL